MKEIKRLVDIYIKHRDELIGTSEELWAISFLGDEDNGNGDFDGCQVGDDKNHRDISTDLVNLSNKITENTNNLGITVDQIIEQFTDIIEELVELIPRKAD